MRRVDDLGVELARAVPLELGADERDVLRRVEEAVRRAVERHEAAAPVDVVEQGLFLLGADRRRCWRRSSRASYCASVSRVQVAELLGIGDVDAPAGEHRRDLRGPVGRTVVPLVAQEQDLDRRGRGAGAGREARQPLADRSSRPVRETPRGRAIVSWVRISGLHREHDRIGASINRRPRRMLGLDHEPVRIDSAARPDSGLLWDCRPGSSRP